MAPCVQSKNDSSLDQKGLARIQKVEKIQYKGIASLPGVHTNQKVQLRRCSVKLKRLIYKEVMVWTRAPGMREVFYVSEKYNYGNKKSDSNISDKPKYDDWRSVTFESYNFPSRLISKLPLEYDSSNMEPTLNLHLSFPETQNVFNVKDSSDDLHAILHVLTGEGMSIPIMDAYIMLQLERYRVKVKEESLKRSQAVKLGFQLRHQKRKERRPINFQYLMSNFMMVRDRDQPISTFKVNPKYSPKLENAVLKSCTLIAPLYCSKHFYLAVFHFPTLRVQVYDSSWQYLPLQLRIHQIKTILYALSDDPVNWRFDFIRNCSPQLDEYSCGVYTIFYAENLLKGELQRSLRRLSVGAVKNIRKRIVKELLLTTSIGTQILEALTSL